MNTQQIIDYLTTQSDKKRLPFMKRYGINTDHALGIPLSILRPYAKQIGTNHQLAIDLWDTRIHEARILATIIDDPKQVTEEQMEQWAAEFNSWDICDQCCLNLFDKTIYVHKKISEWTQRKEEFVKRAGFVLIVALAIHDKNAADDFFDQFFPPIKRENSDDRTYVKKAVNWALRSIGKRNLNLNEKSIEIANEIIKKKNKTAQWIAKDAIRELRSEKIQKRLQTKSRK